MMAFLVVYNRPIPGYPLPELLTPSFIVFHRSAGTSISLKVEQQLASYGP